MLLDISDVSAATLFYTPKPPFIGWNLGHSFLKKCGRLKRFWENVIGHILGQ